MKGLIGAYDVSQSDAVQAHVVQVLQRTGIERVIVPAGVEFDPSSYEAVSTEATSDPTQVKRVAKTIRPGWKGATGMIRYAQVAVWVAPGVENEGTA